MNNLTALTKAYKFAAHKHTRQRRKGVKDIPYINHPIEVVNLLCFTLKDDNYNLLIAGVLHDTIEDTDTTENEIEQLFGQEVVSVVLEVTDDMTTSKAVRWKKQIEGAKNLSDEAKQIKIADKTCNILDMLTTRFEWTKRMKREYVAWAQEVVSGCRGVNVELEKEFDKSVHLAKEVLGNI